MFPLPIPNAVLSRNRYSSLLGSYASFVTDATLSSGCTHYYDFNETGDTIPDRVSLANGSVVGADFEPSGIQGACRRYVEANTDYVFLSGCRVDVTSDYSFGCWFTIDNNSGVKNLVQENDSSNSQRWSLVVSTNTVVYRQEDDGGANQDVSVNSLSLDTWYHAVCTYDASAGEMKLYVNGAEPGSRTITKPTGNQNGDATVGYVPVTSFGPHDGKIDEMAFWDRTLTGSEVVRWYNGGSGIPYN